MKHIILVFILVINFTTFCQVKKDSDTNLSKFQSRKLSTTRMSNNLRVGIGVQRNFQSEIGYSRIRFTSGCTGFFAKTYYSAIEYVPKTQNYEDVLALKIGLEYNLSILALGLETKYITDFDNKNFAIVPKIGFGFGLVNAFYGYNFFTNNNPFPSLGHHQFTLVFNILAVNKNDN